MGNFLNLLDEAHQFECTVQEAIIHIISCFGLGVWYMLDDVRSEPPPPCQALPCKKKGWKVVLPFSTSYQSLGGHEILIGPAAFTNFYYAMTQSPQLHVQGKLDKLVSAPMSFPVVVISEALRFVLLLAWIIVQFGKESWDMGLQVPVEYSQHFNSWITGSREMFNPNPPENLLARLGIVKTPKDMSLPCRGDHEVASSSSASSSSSNE